MTEQNPDATADAGDLDAGADEADTEEGSSQADPADDAEPESDDTDSSDTRVYDARYVSGLRRDIANYRTRAQTAEARAEQLAETLWTARVAELGLLADPADLPYAAEQLDDPDAIRTAAEALLEAKPHLRSRRITERVGQGENHHGAGVSLTQLLREGA